MGQENIAGLPWVGHYDTWKLDCLHRLIEKDHGLVFLPEHNCTSDYRDTPKSLQMGAIQPQDPHSAVAGVKIRLYLVVMSNSYARHWEFQFLLYWSAGKLILSDYFAGSSIELIS
jgi:hypothetical protein